MLPLETVRSPSPRHCNYVLSGRLSRPRVLGNFLLSFTLAAPTNVPTGREFKTSMLGKKDSVSLNTSNDKHQAWLFC